MFRSILPGAASPHRTLLLLGLVIIHSAGSPSIIIGNRVVAESSPALSGIGIEDANHQLYGGLYAQMVFGESFEEPAGPDGASGSTPWKVPAKDGYFGASQGPTWRTLRGEPSVSSEGAFSGSQCQRLPPGSAVENRGLLGTGMFFQQGRSYDGAVYVRSANGSSGGRLTISAVSGNVVSAEVILERKWSSTWQRVDFALKPNQSSVCPLSASSSSHRSTCNGCIDGCVSSPELGDRCIECDGSLRLAADDVSLEIDQVSLMPGSWGLFRQLPVRKDLAEAILPSNRKGMQLTTLRLGGSMILCNGYRWKHFRGSRHLRQPYRGVWYRYNSPGWKIFEFLELCEAAGMIECVVTLNVNENIADLEDLVEYAFGPSDSKWGSLRAKDGREQPYQPFVVEIGNENTLNFTGKEPNPCRDSCANFSSRWYARAQAMDVRAQQLGLNLIFIVGFDAGVGGGQSCSKATVSAVADSIRELAETARSLGSRAVWDCHTGGDSPADGNTTAAALEELQQILHSVNSSMRAAVLEENGGSHNMLRMLGHVTQNHALSRLGKFVVVNTVATGLQPLGRNSNGWDQGHIFFTPNASWLSPPAVAMGMIAAVSKGLSQVLDVAFAGTGLDVLASRSADGKKLGLRVANPTNQTVKAIISLPAGPHDVVEVVMLSSASPSAVRVEPTTTMTSVSQLLRTGWSFPAYSFTTFLCTGTGEVESPELASAAHAPHQYQEADSFVV